MDIEYIKAFTDDPDKGNPAGVIFDADEMTKEEMVKIAAVLGFSESVFILKPTIPECNYRFRFMTKETEVDACGHATLAGAKAIFDKENFSEIKIETTAGVVAVRYEDDTFMMQMAKAEVGEEIYNKETIAKLLGISGQNIEDLPIRTASVGSHKLMIPLTSIEVLSLIKPDFDAMIQFCKENPVKGFYPFVKVGEGRFRARQFNPAAGILEDPITGIAGGALGVYSMEYKLITGNELYIDQGIEMNKPGEIIVKLKDKVVYVGGKAVRFGENKL